MKWSELLLILATLQASLSQNIEVSQIPEVNVIEGSTANLECSYNMSNLDLPIGWYKWYRHVLHGVDIFKVDDFIDRITKVSTGDFLNKTSASIQLHRVTTTDTGMYFCEVEFSGQKQIKGHGEGTFLNVTAWEFREQEVEEKGGIQARTGNLGVLANARGAAVRLHRKLTYSGCHGHAVTEQIASQIHSMAYIVVGALAVTSAILVGACLWYLRVNKHGSSTRDVGPIVYSDFTTQASRSGGAPNQQSQQVSQNVVNDLYRMDNDQYIYAEPRGNKKSKIPKECHDVSLYSEIP
ncbi:hypothetical protein XELAEV_18023793mg [Xenopus laevis]|uniref:Natural cytotoxicity triggering receptor 3 n=1 Tax=Xenopus laevis TaxID=8355 RepID=A0A974HPE5_XENLA|nr:hypothetical protein XELAEV_18023793mg [Xenopus laevis]